MANRAGRFLRPMNFARTIVPIQRQVDRRRFEQFGSGVLLKIERYRILISAAHVILHDRLWLFGEPQNIELNDIEFHTTAPNLAAVKDDEADVGFALLPEAVASSIVTNGFEFLSLARTAFRPPVGSSNRAAFAGFPCSKSRLRMGPGLMELRPVIIEGELLGDEELDRRGLNPDVHLAIRYDRDTQFDALTKMRTNGIEPEGMSGGAIWRFSQERVPWLAGVGTNFDSRQRVLHGTRFEDVLTQISQRIIAGMVEND